MKRFIVTGGYGFIGSNLIIMLLKKKFKVLNLDNLSYAAQKYNLKDIKNKNYLFKKVDINDKKTLIKILKNSNHMEFLILQRIHMSIDQLKNHITLLKIIF